MRVAAIITVWLLLHGSGLSACSGSGNGSPTATPTVRPTMISTDEFAVLLDLTRAAWLRTG